MGRRRIRGGDCRPERRAGTEGGPKGVRNKNPYGFFVFGVWGFAPNSMTEKAGAFLFRLRRVCPW
jgi:hypothetical protein